MFDVEVGNELFCDAFDGAPQAENASPRFDDDEPGLGPTRKIHHSDPFDIIE